VDNPGIGPALASFIDCLSQTSIKHGGLGKVVLVDHSMGGLATRYAASLTKGGRRVSDEIGFVITIGTPNLGSGWANLLDPLVSEICGSTWPVSELSSDCRDYTALQGMRKESDQIQALPWLPLSIPLQAIAGDVTLRATLFNSTATDDTNSDIVVGTQSALAATQVPPLVAEGTGDNTFRCMHGIWNPMSANCSHTGLLADSKVQQLVAQSIASYLYNGPWAPFMTGGGSWYVHGTSKFQIVPHGTSSAAWNIGPCTDPFATGSSGQPEMCNTNIDMVFKPVAGGLFGTITKVWYTTWNGDPPPTGFKVPDGEPLVNQTFMLVPTRSPHHIRAVYNSNSPAGLRAGNPNLCQTGISASLLNRGICGA
jgi:pimeloyl-ACP methyl ester carboxylesterase